eukprot:COSAG02_NODE_23819_length_707_cov_0.960526_1_plen_44_part_00
MGDGGVDGLALDNAPANVTGGGAVVVVVHEQHVDGFANDEACS